jgi:hypothetical protein
MISDVLYEAVSELDHYLTKSLYDDTYRGKLREQITKLRDEALYIAWILDTPPGNRVPPKAKALATIAERRRKQDSEARRAKAEKRAPAPINRQADAKCPPEESATLVMSITSSSTPTPITGDNE